MHSGLYSGLVVHERMRPRRHRLAYRVFSLLIDLDELREGKHGLKLLGFNRGGVLSVLEKDHGDGGDLTVWANARLAEVGIAADGPIRMLCYPRMFGFVFNPLTVYYCYDANDQLKAAIYEVNNTFGGRHAYVLPAPEGTDGAVRHSCDKAFHVSPFMPMACRYRFTIDPPKDMARVLINEDDADGLLLSASFSGKREELTDATLMRALLTHPLMTLKVVAGIHFEAIRMLLKGIPLAPAPVQGNAGNSLAWRTDHAGGDREKQPARQ